jgi:hypothetical protein
LRLLFLTKTEKPFVVGNEVICLKEIQKQITPYLKSFEEESGVKYQYNVKSGLSYKDAVGLRLQINRVDSGLDVRVADLDYYWLQERGACASQRTWYLIVLSKKEQ